MSAPDLSVGIGPLRLANPVLCASGTFGYGMEVPATASRLGGIVTKTITLEPRSGNPPPRIVETPAGMLNSIGLQNVGVVRFVNEKLPALRALGVPIVVSIGGRTPEDFEEVVSRLDSVDGIAACEINISCPNVKEGGLEFCAVPAAAANVLARARRRTARPLWAKLSPNVTSIGTLAKACEEAGADALVAINTFVGMKVDLQARRPVLPNATGGLSGPAIRPLALAKVFEVVRSVRIPVVAVGGIVSGEDALEFLLCGARAVEVGTASFLRPDQPELVIDQIRGFLEREGVERMVDWIGTLRTGEGAR
jgi:dihydroorotate dehydrogenase (NAD+) catalytic subunit